MNVRTSAVIAISALAMALSFELTQYPSFAATEPVGVLVGLHHVTSEAELNGPPVPPAGGSLRTISISIDSSSLPRGTSIVRVPDLLIPRRSGFWRAGLLATCAEERVTNYDDEVIGTAATVADYPWFAPLGRTPVVTLSENSRGYERVGACRARDIRCIDDGRVHVAWVWPEYASLNFNGEVSCGAHPDGHREPTIRSLDRPARALSIAQVLGSAADARLRNAYESAKRDQIKHKYWEEARQWGGRRDVPDFPSTSWNIERQAGHWRVVGWTATHRLAGYGFDYTLDADLSRVTGRKSDDGPTLLLASQKHPRLKDAHDGPQGWVLAVSETELLVLRNARSSSVVARVPISADDTVIMVEWAAGGNVARWAAGARDVAARGGVKPRIVRPKSAYQ